MLAVTPRNARAIRGKPLPARTELLAARPAPGVSPTAQEVRVRIETGVMHQIRCHLASLGWPIVGDPIYGEVPSSRLWLHAETLEFRLASGTWLSVEAALPDGWPD